MIWLKAEGSGLSERFVELQSFQKPKVYRL